MDGICWCASEIKCPHGISSRLVECFDEMEKMVDEAICQFDRRSVRRFLKRDEEHMVMKEPNDILKPKDSSNSPQVSGRRKKIESDIKSASDQRPSTSAHPSRLTTSSNLFSRSTSSLQKLSNSKDSLPRISSAIPSKDRKQAWSQDNTDPDSIDLDNISDNEGDDDFRQDDEVNKNSKVSSSAPPSQIDATINAGLMRLVDKMARKILPWQALLCPRALESLLTIRLQVALSRQNNSITEVKNHAKTQASQWVSSRQSEVTNWSQSAWNNWQQGLADQGKTLRTFLFSEQTRLLHLAKTLLKSRTIEAAKQASIVDENEREKVRAQLQAFRVVVSSTYDPSRIDGTKMNEEAKTLKDAIAYAKALVNEGPPEVARDHTRKYEDSKDWLASLGENALTAARSESALKELYETLDAAQNDGSLAQNNLLDALESQSDSLINALETFTGQANRQYSDFVTRELLIIRGFRAYILGLLQGEMKSHASEDKKNQAAWGSRSLINRCLNLSQNIDMNGKNAQKSIQKVLSLCKEQILSLSTNVKMQMQSLARARAAEARSRKAALHSALARHVNLSCNDRRMRLKEAISRRREEFELETTIITRVDELTTTLRSQLDIVWVKEHLKLRSLSEGAKGRQSRLAQAARLSWHKHSMLSKNIEEDESYHDWIRTYEKDRNADVKKDDKTSIESWKYFRQAWHSQFKSLLVNMNSIIQVLMEFSGKSPSLFLTESFLKLQKYREYRVGLLDAEEKDTVSGTVIPNRNYYGLEPLTGVDFGPQTDDAPETEISRSSTSLVTLTKKSSSSTLSDALKIGLPSNIPLPWEFPEYLSSKTHFILDKYIAEWKYHGDFNIQSALVEKLFDDAQDHLLNAVSILSSQIDLYNAGQSRNLTIRSKKRQDRLLKTWQSCLDRLDGQVNRRIARLKDMESDLEESIRLCLLQEESAQSVAEQSACFRLESLWMQWQSKVSDLAMTLTTAQQEFDISRAKARIGSNSSGVAGSTFKKPPIGDGSILSELKSNSNETTEVDNSIDKLVSMAKEAALSNNVMSPGTMRPRSAKALNSARMIQNELSTPGAAASNEILGSGPQSSPGLSLILEDTSRVKSILDSSPPSSYKAFIMEASSSLERIRRELGNGKSQKIPGFAIAQAVASASLTFYNKANLGESCAGRMTCQGALVYPQGLPKYADSTFALIATITYLSYLSLPQGLATEIPSIDEQIKMQSGLRNTRVAGWCNSSPWALSMGFYPADEALSLLDQNRVFFCTALVAMSRPLHEFGEYMLKEECAWHLSVFGIPPPPSFLEGLAQNGPSEHFPKGLEPKCGLASDDLRDLLNNLMSHQVDLFNVEKQRIKYLNEWEESYGIADLKKKYDQQEDENDNLDIPDEPKIIHLLGDLNKFNPLPNVVDKLKGKISSRDIALFSCLLGRPDGSMDLSTHHVCQAVYAIRKAGIAALTLSLAPPNTEFPRVQDLIQVYMSSPAVKRKNQAIDSSSVANDITQNNLVCSSPFDVIQHNIDFYTNIPGLPISYLQSLCIMTISGNCDYYIEDPRQSLKHERLPYDLLEFIKLQLCRIPKSMLHLEKPAITLASNIAERIKAFDLNDSGKLPLEVLRLFVETEDYNITHKQISLFFHALCYNIDELDYVEVPVGENFKPLGASSPLIVNSYDHEKYKEKMKSHLAKYSPTISSTTPLLKNEEENNDDTQESNIASAPDSLIPIVQTKFDRDPDIYMKNFSKDVGRYLEAMPTIDTNVIAGWNKDPMTSTSTIQLISDSMKLDASSRNPMPSSAVLWIGNRIMKLQDALNSLCLLEPLSKKNNWILNVTKQSMLMPCDHKLDSLSVGMTDEITHQAYIKRLRTFIELDLIIRFPELSEKIASEEFYGPGGSIIPIHEKYSRKKLLNKLNKLNIVSNSREYKLNKRRKLIKKLKSLGNGAATSGEHHDLDLEAIFNDFETHIDEEIDDGNISSESDSDDESNTDHWKELLARRLHRLDRLIFSWRETMMNEWANTIYLARQNRYEERVDIVEKAMHSYHEQYASLREEIIESRLTFINLYKGLENRILTITQDSFAQLSYRTGYYSRTIRRYQFEIERFVQIMKSLFHHYQQHCGSIRYNSLDRVYQTCIQLQRDLQESCNDLIHTFVHHYGQKLFDKVYKREELFVSHLVILQTNILGIKESFILKKDEADRDLTLMITDRLTLDRVRCQDHLDQLTASSSSIVSVLSTVKEKIVQYQQDANARLIIKIEKMVRHCRKLRSVIDNDVQKLLMSEVHNELRELLKVQKGECMYIVDDVHRFCLDMLKQFETKREEHRTSMRNKVNQLDNHWNEVEKVLMSWLNNYEHNMMKSLMKMNVEILQLIHEHEDEEHRSLQFDHNESQSLLVQQFRHHFCNHDLHEAELFLKFDTEIDTTLSEIITLYGPKVPKFLTQSTKELKELINESSILCSQDMRNDLNTRGDQRLMFHNTLSSAIDTNKNNFYIQDDDPFMDGILDDHDEIALQRMEISDLFSFYLNQSVDMVANHIPEVYDREKNELLNTVDQMKMQKNGDMIKYQVEVVVDLLITCIEMHSDLHQGYDRLMVINKKKSSEAVEDWKEFYTRYATEPPPSSSSSLVLYDNNEKEVKSQQSNNLVPHPLSIKNTLFLSSTKIQTRREEVNALLKASQLHIVADNEKLDLLVTSNKHDIDEWKQLTIQLVDSAFDQAHANYLGDDDRNTLSTQNASFTNSTNNLLLGAPPSLHVNETEEKEQDLFNNERINKLRQMLDEKTKLPVKQTSSSQEVQPYQPIQSGVSFKGDPRMLMELIANLDTQPEPEPLIYKEETPRDPIFDLPPGMKFTDMVTRELQQGWFACLAPEGHVYYHKPETNESLWDLPADLKVPLYPEDSFADLEILPREKDNFEDAGVIDTPRAYLAEALALPPSNAVLPSPIRIVDTSYNLKEKVEPQVVIAEILNEAKKVAEQVTQTAVDVTSLLLHQSQSNPGSRSIFKPAPTLSTLLDNHIMRGHGFGEEDIKDIKNELDDKENVVEIREMVNEKLVKDDEKHPEELTDLLLEMSIGENIKLINPESTSALPGLNWLQMGLGDNFHDNEYDSSDDENNKKRITTTSIPPPSKLTLPQRKYIEACERDDMAKEDELSTQYENYLENQICHDLLNDLTSLKAQGICTIEDKQRILSKSKLVKPVNLYDILAELHITLSILDQWVKEKNRRDEMRLQQIEDLKTEEGKARQDYILQHAEDIEEMTQFLHQESSLGRVKAKQLATDLILKNIATPKKLAKLVQKGDLNLNSFIYLDDDDVDLIKQSLWILVNGQPNPLAMSTLLPNNSLLSLPQFNNSFAQQESFPQFIPEITTRPTTSATDYNPVNSTSSNNFDNSLLEPGTYTKVDYIDDDNDRRDFGSQSNDPEQQAQTTASMEIDKPVLEKKKSIKLDKNSFKINKDGYKSWKGGWIEANDENNETYYYNVKNGESSWELPDEVSINSDDESLNDLHNNNDNNLNQSWPEFRWNSVEISSDIPDVFNNWNPEFDNYKEEVPSDAYENNLGNFINPQEISVSNAPAWTLSEAFGVTDEFVGFPRIIPTFTTREAYSIGSLIGAPRGDTRQIQGQAWAQALSSAQAAISEFQASAHKQAKSLAQAASNHIEESLKPFTLAVRSVTKEIKEELGQARASERDLRRIYDEGKDNDNLSVNSVEQAEKLSFLLEALEKLKVSVSVKYKNAFQQIENLIASWENLRGGLEQSLILAEEGVSQAYSLSSQSSRAEVNEFKRAMINQIKNTSKNEISLLRRDFRKEFVADTREMEISRDQLRSWQADYLYNRKTIRDNLIYNERIYNEAVIEQRLEEQGYPAIPQEELMLNEEELVLSLLINQVEMETALAADYESMLKSTENMQRKMEYNIEKFEQDQLDSLNIEGSLFINQTETVERHEQALHATLSKLREKINEGYQLLQTKLETLDYEVEQAAEQALSGKI